MRVPKATTIKKSSNWTGRRKKRCWTEVCTEFAADKAREKREWSCRCTETRAILRHPSQITMHDCVICLFGDYEVYSYEVSSLQISAIFLEYT